MVGKPIVGAADTCRSDTYAIYVIVKVMPLIR